MGESIMTVEFAYNDAFSSVLAEFLDFFVHFSSAIFEVFGYSDAFCRSRSILFLYNSGSESMGREGSTNGSGQGDSNLSKRTFSFHFSSSFNSVID